MTGGGGSSTTTTTQQLSPEQRALIAPVIPIAQKYLKNPPKQYPGSGIVGFQPLQQQAQQMTIDAANSFLSTAQQQTGRFNDVVGGYNNMRPGTNFLTSGQVLYPESNPALQGAIEAASRPTIQQFQEQLMPSITQGAIGSGSFGGTRQGIAEGIATRGATQTIGDIAARMASENYQAGLGAMTQGLAIGGQNLQGEANTLGNMGNILQQGLLPANLKEAVGTQEQGMKQALLSEQVQKFINEQMIPFAVAKDVAAMAFGMPGGSTVSQTTGSAGGMGAGGQIAMGGLSMLPMLLGKSDRRLKTAVKQVEKFIDGLTMYMFKYIGTAIEVLGLMADEVEQVYPNAVVVDRHGYKTVHYPSVPTWQLRSN